MRRTDRFPISVGGWAWIPVVLSLLWWPGDGMAMDGDHQFRFADQYFTSQAFAEAIPEWRRFLFFCPEDPRRTEAMYKLGVSYLKTGKYGDAITSFRTVLDAGDTPFRLDAGVKLAETYRTLGEFNDGIGWLDQLIDECDVPAGKNRALYEAGWYCISGGRFKMARDYFGRMDTDHRGSFHADGIMAALEDDMVLPQKSTTLSGLCALFPGGGYLYLERYQDSLASFLVTSTLLWATYEAADHEEYALGTLLGVTALGFYGGGMVGAMNGAHRHNQRIKRLYIEDLEYNYRIHMGAAFHSDGTAYVGCYIPF